MRRRGRRVLAGVLLLLALAAGWRTLRPRLRPAPPAPDAATLAHVEKVRILRDRWGVAHVFGDSDADAAFGLAYAHAEDDWPTIQGVLAAERGRLSLLLLSKMALGNDYYVALVGVPAQVEAQYPTLAPDVRAVLEAYARGLNYYAWKHPAEADGRLLPITGKDIAAGFAHKLPVLMGFTGALSHVVEHPPEKVGDPLPAVGGGTGSNEHAVHRARSSDDVTRLNVNSHQPWEGPVAWHEIHVHSNQGWDASGATFPGAPFVLHGHNAHLGWAHTVNTPDLVDVYLLTTREGAGGAIEYQLGDRWLPLEKAEAEIVIDTGFFEWTSRRDVLRSAHGPVMKTDRGYFAFRYAAMDRLVRAAEQWFRMNKARDLAEWKAAMAIGAVPEFNTAYADRDHIFYVYNAALPRRAEGADYTRVLPGDREGLIWRELVPFAELPQVEDPPSGFVQNCNSTPWHTTTGDANPRADAWPPTAGIEAGMTNRALRSLQLLGGDGPVSREAFLAMKWDRGYAPEADIYRRLIAPLLAATDTGGDEKAAIELLRGWDGRTDEGSPAAALAIAAWRWMTDDGQVPADQKLDDPREALRRALRLLGGTTTKLGDVQRLRRGTVDLPLGGGPDVLNAAYTHEKDGKLVAYQGDSYVMLVEFTAAGVVSSSIHQYGSSNRPSSPHFADQAPLFVRHELKPVWRTEADIRANLEKEYRPGEERNSAP